MVGAARPAFSLPLAPTLSPASRSPIWLVLSYRSGNRDQIVTSSLGLRLQGSWGLCQLQSLCPAPCPLQSPSLCPGGWHRPDPWQERTWGKLRTGSPPGVGKGLDCVGMAGTAGLTRAAGS